MQCLKVIIITKNSYIRLAVKSLAKSVLNNINCNYFFIDYKMHYEFSKSINGLTGNLFGYNSIVFIDKSDAVEVSEFIRLNTYVIPPNIDRLLFMITLGVYKKYESMCESSVLEYKLSQTEKRVVKYLLNGMRVVDISRRENKSIKTISSHKRNAMKKLNVSSLQKLYVNCIIN